MKHVLQDHHKEHLRTIGIESPPDHLEVEPDEYREHYEGWKRTLPSSGHNVWHKKALGHIAWKRHTASLVASVTPTPEPVAESSPEPRAAAAQAPVINVQAPPPVVIPTPAIHVRFPHAELRVIIGILVLIFLFLCIFVPKAHPQGMPQLMKLRAAAMARTRTYAMFAPFSQINYIQTCNGASCAGANQIGFHTSPFTIRCSTNMTCTDDGATFLLTASSTAGAAWDALTNPIAGGLALQQFANGNDFWTVKRKTDTTPTGNFERFQNAAAADLWAIDITGSLTAGSVPIARLSASSITLNTTAPIGGGGTVTLGNALTFTCSTCATTTNGGALSATAPVTISAAGVIAATSHGGTARVQLSDNTGTSGNYAKYAANGDVTDGGGVAVITTRTIGTTAPITGGGDLSADRTIALTSHGGTARAQLSDNTGTSGNGAKFAANGDITDGGFVAANVVTASSAAAAAKQTCISNSTDKTCVYIDFPDAKYFPAAICVNAVAAQAWSAGATPAATCRAGTNNKDAFLGPFGASDVAYFKVHLPKDWDTATNPSLMLDVASTDATNGHTVIMQESVACAKLDGSTTDDVAFNAARSLSTVTLNGNANRTWEADLALNGTDMTGCSAPGIMWVKVSRTTDTATNVEVYGAMLTIPRLLTVQAN